MSKKSSQTLKQKRAAKRGKAEHVDLQKDKRRRGSPAESFELQRISVQREVRLGTIDRVIYNLAEWAKAPKRLPIDGRAVRLAGYSRQPVDTIKVIGFNRSKIVLLVVPTDTESLQVHDTMMAPRLRTTRRRSRAYSRRGR